MKSIPAWLRWVLILPAAIIGYVVIQFVVALANSFTMVPELIINWVCQVTNSIAGPVFFVTIGTIVAPNHSFIVSIVLTVLFAMFYSLLVVIAIMNKNFPNPLWWLITSGFIGIGSSIVVCVYYHQAEIKGEHM